MTYTCSKCKKEINLVYDKYYKITVEYDGRFRESTEITRQHKRCYEGKEDDED